jgi:hypothetical protein
MNSKGHSDLRKGWVWPKWGAAVKSYLLYATEDGKAYVSFKLLEHCGPFVECTQNQYQQ